MKELSWQLRNRIAGATSLGCPGRPSVLDLPKRSTFSGGKDAGINGVQIGPGATPLTRIPRGANLCAIARMNDRIAPFVAE